MGGFFGRIQCAMGLILPRTLETTSDDEQILDKIRQMPIQSVSSLTGTMTTNAPTIQRKLN
jgi:hypothetical protein